MSISKEMLDKFNDIHESTHGYRLSDQEAISSAHALVRLMEIIYRPLPKEKDDINLEE